VRSIGFDREVIVEKEDVNRCLEVVIRDLIPLEMYEECAVLHKIKQEFNDNK
jgi:hypothetical protein